MVIWRSWTCRMQCLYSIRLTISSFLTYFQNNLVYFNNFHFKNIMPSFPSELGCSTTKKAISLERTAHLRWLKFRPVIIWCAWHWFLLVSALCYLVWITVLAVAFLMYYIPRNSLNAVIPGNILDWLIVTLPLANRVEDGALVSTEVLQMASTVKFSTQCQPDLSSYICRKHSFLLM